MGQEIVYCFRCQVRLSSADLQKGNAVRFSNHVTCLKCAPALLSSLPLAEQQHLLKVLGGSAGTEVPRPEAGKPAPRTPAPAVAPRDLPVASKHQEAAARARAFAREHPDDLDGQVRAYRQAIFACEGTPLAAELGAEMAAAQARIARVVEAALPPLEDELRALLGKEAFGGALKLLAERRTLHPFAEWTLAVDKRVREVKEDVVKRFDLCKAEALAAKGAGAAGDVERLAARVKSWGLPALEAELEKALRGE